MKEYLSKRVNRLKESQTLLMASKSRELESKGIKVIKLNLGEPDFETPAHIKAAAHQAITDNYTFYPPIQGFPDLIESIVYKLKTENGLAYTKENIIVSTGAKQSIVNAMFSLLNKGDEAIVFSPFWVSYTEQIKLAQGIPIYIEGIIENDFKVTIQQLKSAITSKTRLIIFSSPCNPTGSVFTKKELEEMANLVSMHPKIFIISDEIYEYITFECKHESIAQFENIKEQVILINGLSKGFSMTGWRLGYMAAPAWIAQACKKIQGQITSGACSITQRAAIAAIRGDKTDCERMRQAYFKRRNLAKSLLDKIQGIQTNIPAGAFYLFPNVSSYFGKSFNSQKIKNGYDLVMFLLNEAHVSVVDGAAFGEPKCIRISFAAPEEKLIEAITNIRIALNKLK